MAARQRAEDGQSRRQELSQVVGRSARTELVVREQRSSLIVTTTLPFGESSKVFSAPLCSCFGLERVLSSSGVCALAATGRTRGWALKSPAVCDGGDSSAYTGVNAR